jgi:serine protease AprX
MPVVKVFGSPKERASLGRDYTLLADYDAFTLLDVSESEVKILARRHLVEDITSQYALPISRPEVTRAPRPQAVARAAARRPATPASPKPPSPGRHHHIVQFVGPIKRSWLAGVTKAGGEPRAPFEGFAYIVRANARTLQAIKQLPYVRWTGHLPHAARIADATKRRAAASGAAAVSSALPRTKIRAGVYTVQFFGPDDLKRGAGSIKKLGFKILDRPDDPRILIVESTKPQSARTSQLARLSAVHGIQKIRERSLKRPTNDVAAGLMGANALTGPGLGLTGKNQIIAVCDTGLDTGDAATIHPDFAGRIVAIRSFPITPDFSPAIHNPQGNDGAPDRDSGHGTHVAGSVLGDGTSSVGLPDLAGRVRGLAHKAKLVFQAVEQELDWKDPADETDYGRFVLAGIPADLTVLLQDAYARGARIHSNSWNGGDPGAYDAQREQLDRFVWNHKDMCVLVAAGNDGTDKDGDGAINEMSVTSPSTAKNCITVGASEHRRPAFNTERYGDWWPRDYPAAPFSNAPMADNPRHIVAFSSRGPTADGRFKPEVLAPGTFVLSTRSTRIAANNHAWAAFPHSRHYFHMGGTSMATPLAAGAVGLVREYYRKKSVARPSAALLKATLIASTRRLPRPGARLLVDNDQGYGLIHLASALKPSSNRKLVYTDRKAGLGTGQLWSRTVQLTGGATLRVVLAYSELPGRGAGQQSQSDRVQPGRETVRGQPEKCGKSHARCREQRRAC